MGGGRIDRLEDRLGPKTLRAWAPRYQTDNGMHACTTNAEAQRVKELKRKVKGVRQASEIWKLDSAHL